MKQDRLFEPVRKCNKPESAPNKTAKRKQGGFLMPGKRGKHDGTDSPGEWSEGSNPVLDPGILRPDSAGHSGNHRGNAKLEAITLIPTT